MKRNIKQLRAISYSYTRQKQKKADCLVEKLLSLGININVSKYPAVTIKRCMNFMEV